MKPAQRRAAAGYAQERFGLSQRRACRVVGAARSTIRYRPQGRGDDEAVRDRLREVAAERPRFGYRTPIECAQRAATAAAALPNDDGLS